jgi:hypothetical protein
MIDLLTDATGYSLFQIAAVIAEQMEQPYIRSDNIRTAVMYCPLVMTRAEFIAAASLVGIDKGSAGNRFREVRMFQRELGEVA